MRREGSTSASISLRVKAHRRMRFVRAALHPKLHTCASQSISITNQMCSHSSEINIADRGLGRGHHKQLQQAASNVQRPKGFLPDNRDGLTGGLTLLQIHSHLFCVQAETRRRGLLPSSFWAAGSAPRWQSSDVSSAKRTKEIKLTRAEDKRLYMNGYTYFTSLYIFWRGYTYFEWSEGQRRGEGQTWVAAHGREVQRRCTYHVPFPHREPPLPRKAANVSRHLLGEGNVQPCSLL